SPATGSREAGRGDVIELGTAESVFRSGDNVLAVAGANVDLRSSDFSLAMELEYRVPPKRSKEGSESVDLRLSEIAFRRAGTTASSLSWVEFEVGDLSKPLLCTLSDDPSKLDKWSVTWKPEQSGRRSVSASDLGVQGAIGSADTGAVLYLSANGKLIDAMRVPLVPPAPGREFSVGRVGNSQRVVVSVPTRDAANRREMPSLLTISEIHYHPPGDDDAREFVEIHNRGKGTISLDGLALRGAVTFAFPSGASIGPGGYLVVAKEPELIRRERSLDAKTVIGPFLGKLSNREERLQIRDAFGMVLDSVEFSDRAPWPNDADGWGSTLELLDPSADNSEAAAWTASDQSSRSKWETVNYKAGVYLFSRMSASSFQFMLLDAGECLIDDIKVVADNGKVVIDESFDGENTEWKGHGTHQNSRLEKRGSESYFRLVTEGRGNSRQNYVSLVLDPELDEDQRYTVSFRVRYLRGSRLLLSRTSGQALARMTRLKPVPLPGSPGGPSAASRRLAPIISAPDQTPVAPKASQSVRLVAEVSSGGTVAKAQIRYRHESSEEWKTAALKPTGVTFAGEIPGLASGRVEYVIEAEDSGGRRSTFPPLGTKAPAQYLVGLTPEPGLPNYTVLVTDAEWDAFRARPRMSNLPMRATLVYGTKRIFQDVRFRVRGSGFTRGSRNWRLIFGSETLDGRQALTFDGQANDRSKAKERAVYWLLDSLEVPTPRQRYMHLNIYGHREEGGVYEEVEKVDGDYLANWFENPDDPAQTFTPLLHKLDDYWDFRPPRESDGQQTQRFGGFFGGGRRGRGE
ncbi:MAG: lamin tail domain-containing protein, partial [Planctomycetota bacterium]